jgi:hypothetical protein
MYRLTKYFHFARKGAKMGRRRAHIALLVILGAFILGACPSTASSQPVVLKSGMPNTITLPNGEVVYDLNGEWDVVYALRSVGFFTAGGYESESMKDIVRITQEGNKFAGIKVIGDSWVGKNQGAVQGELEKNRFGKLYAFRGMILRWVPGKGEISEDGNKIVIKARPHQSEIMTIVLKRK